MLQDGSGKIRRFRDLNFEEYTNNYKLQRYNWPPHDQKRLSTLCTRRYMSDRRSI